MTETPDFERTAARLLQAIHAEDVNVVTRQILLDALKTMWNARGAADIAKLDTELSILMGATAAGPYVKNLDRALRALDR